MEKLKVKYPVPEEERHKYAPTKIPVAIKGGRGYNLGGFVELGDAINQFRKDGTLKEGFKLIDLDAREYAIRNGINEAGYADIELIKE